jgi:hypothetical protein
MAEEALRGFARDINEIARSVVAEDGEHAAMFFLALPDGAVEHHLFLEERERPVGDARGREIADAVVATSARAVVCVSEAWSARPEAVPVGGGAGDAPEACDVLLVAGIDVDGDSVAIETPLRRTPEGGVEIGDSQEWGSDYRLAFLDPVRAAFQESLG